MLTIGCMSLSGGQGKTTVALQLALYLADTGYRVLVVDCDPQSNLTTFLGHTVEASEPTLLEMIRGSVTLADSIYPTDQTNLSLIPSDDGLTAAHDYLSSCGVGALLLKQRLEAADCDVCILDAPPQRSQMCMTILGASDYLIIPAEASVKGYGSLVRTLDALNEVRGVRASQATIMGVIPFRDRWVGARRVTQSEDAIAAMAEEIGEALMLPTIRESEKYKTAIGECMTLRAMGYSDLGYPFEVLIQKIQEEIDDKGHGNNEKKAA